MKYTVIVSLTLFGLACAEPRSGAQNVCLKTQMIPKQRRVEKPREYTIKYKEQCNIFGTCDKKRTEIHYDSVLETILEKRTIRQCCPGFAEAPNGDCSPICLNSCRNGDCVAPGLCKCNPEPTDTSPGYTGSSCNRFVCLAANRWGPKCDQSCSCPPNSYCKATTGECLCRAGWTGADCTEECGVDKKCEEFDSLPAMAEPEANLISAPLKLDNMERSATMESVADDRSSLIHQLAAHTGMNMVLIFVVFSLIVVILAYKKRLEQARNESYYSSVASDRSAYSGDDSTYGERDPDGTPVSKRPMPPTPDQAAYYTKNLNFDTATRIAVNGASLSPPKGGQTFNNRFVVDPKIESHLVRSQEKSRQNLYSDISSCGKESGKISTISMTDDGHYQVPKSRPNVSLTTNDQNNSIYEYDESCLYEEIKPRPPSKSDETGPQE